MSRSPRFAASWRAGGALIATGETSLYDAWGDPRPDFGLADLLGVRGGRPGSRGRASPTARRQRDAAHFVSSGHRAGRADGIPCWRDSTRPTSCRSVALWRPLTVDPRCQVPLTFIPPFPIFPPETAWMRQPRTTIPGLVINESRAGRVVFLPADIDRRFAIDHLPDHGDLLANLVRWAARGNLPLEVRGRGLIDCELYRQPGRLILHLVNLTSAGTWRPPVDELIPVGPFQIRVRLPEGVRPSEHEAAGLRDDKSRCAPREGWVEFEVDSVLDHEVVVLES